MRACWKNYSEKLSKISLNLRIRPIFQGKHRGWFFDVRLGAYRLHRLLSARRRLFCNNHSRGTNSHPQSAAERPDIYRQGRIPYVSRYMGNTHRRRRKLHFFPTRCSLFCGCWRRLFEVSVFSPTLSAESRRRGRPSCIRCRIPRRFFRRRCNRASAGTAGQVLRRTN